MTPSEPPEVAVRIERTLHAPPERVFQAFLDPELIRRWIAPDELTVDRVVVDARVGGKLEVWHSRNGESTGKFEGRFVQIDPPRELVYRWAFVGTEPERGEYYDTLVTVRISAEPHNRSRIRIVHERLEELRRGAPEIHVRLRPGWDRCLAKLEEALGPISGA